MISRTAGRTTKNLRVIRNVRYNTTQASKSGGGSGAVAGGLAGGLVAFGLGYSYYHFSGAKAAVNMASDTKAYFENMKSKLADKAPEPSAALKYIREYALSYATFIPGAKPIIDSAFDDLDKVQSKHGDKVDKLVTDTYHELKDVAKDGMTMESAMKAWDILQKKFEEIKHLAKDVSGDLLSQHPELKEKVGGKFDDLKQMADQYGPDAKKQVDEVYQKAQDIAAKGLSAGSITEISKLATDKYNELKKAGEEAYSNGFEKTIKPLLEKYPEAKKFMEENKDAFRSSNLDELTSRVKKAVDSKDLSGLQDYATEKAKSMTKGSGFEKYFDSIPGGHEIFTRIQEISHAAKEHGDEAKSLSEKTFKEVQDILSKRAEEAKKLGEKAASDAKK